MLGFVSFFFFFGGGEGGGGGGLFGRFLFSFVVGGFL